MIALIFGSLSIYTSRWSIYRYAMYCDGDGDDFVLNRLLCGITFGINIINTAFLSPSILISHAASSQTTGFNGVANNAPTEPGAVYCFYVGFHIVLFCAAIEWRFFRGAAKQASVSE